MRRQLAFAPMPCLCGTQATRSVLRRDRYLLPVHIAVCDGCGLVHSARNLRSEALPEFYRTHYRRYYENLHHRRQIAKAAVVDRYTAMQRLQAIREVVPQITSVLEIGAGLGYFLDACRTERITPLLGFEPGELFRHHACAMGLEVRGDDYLQAASLPFAPQLVVLFHVLEHLADPAACLRWVAQQLGPDGTLVVEVPDIDGDWSALGLFNFHLAHRWYFSAATLGNLLAQQGFTPYFISRSDRDGIYPGNLRIFARRGEAGAGYPLPVPAAPLQEARIRAWVRPFSLRCGIPRAAWRLCRWRLARRTGISGA